LGLFLLSLSRNTERAIRTTPVQINLADGQYADFPTKGRLSIKKEPKMKKDAPKVHIVISNLSHKVCRVSSDIGLGS